MNLIDLIATILISMKVLVLIVIGIICFNSSFAQYNSQGEFINKLDTLRLHSKPNNFKASSRQDSTWNNVRALNEINYDSLADAYPWISPDGLRLYLTKDTGIGYDSLFVSSRPSIN